MHGRHGSGREGHLVDNRYVLAPNDVREGLAGLVGPSQVRQPSTSVADAMQNGGGDGDWRKPSERGGARIADRFLNVQSVSRVEDHRYSLAVAASSLAGRSHKGPADPAFAASGRSSRERDDHISVSQLGLSLSSEMPSFACHPSELPRFGEHSWLGAY